MFTRLRIVKILFGFSILFGVLAIICGVVYWESPKHGIAVMALLSMLGGFGSLALSFIFGIAGYVVKSVKPSDF